MKRTRFSEEQIIGILKEHETGVSVADLCRRKPIGCGTSGSAASEPAAEVARRSLAQAGR